MAFGIRLFAFAVVAAFMMLPSADAKLFVSFGPCHANFINDIEACLSYISWADEKAESWEYEDVFKYNAFIEGASFDIVRSDSTNMGTYKIPDMRGSDWAHHRAFVSWSLGGGEETEEGLLFQWFVNPEATSSIIYHEEYCGYFADSVLNLPSGYTYKIVPGSDITDLVPSGVEFVDAGYFPVRDWNASRSLKLKADNDSFYADHDYLFDGCSPQIEIRYKENLNDSYILGIVKVRFKVREKEYVVNFPMSRIYQSFGFPFYWDFNGAPLYGGYVMMGLLSNYYVDHTTQEELDIYQFYYRECFTDDDCKSSSLCAWYGSTLCIDGQCTSPSECFIATAALGTPLNPRLWVLRSWRDSFLLKHSLTKSFVHFYYRISPPIARFLYTHPMMSAVVRWSVILPAILVLEHLSLSWLVLISVSTILLPMVVGRW